MIYKCMNCGGNVVYDPQSGHMKCMSCGGSDCEQSIPSETPMICPACGTQITYRNEYGSAGKCPACGVPIIRDDFIVYPYGPDVILPFKVSKRDAEEKLKQEFGKKLFLPSDFLSTKTLERLRGVYVPFWLFNTEADANIRYRGTRTRFWSDSRYDYTETSHFLINRGGTIGFDKVPVDGDSKIPDDLMESIEPYDLKEAVPFQTAYLAGYLADRYDVDSEKSAPRANERVKKSVEREFEETVSGYSTVVAENISVQLHDGSAQYALLPVWILNTTWEGKHYLFAMNGQTGKFVGDLPADKNAARKMTIKLTVIITIVVYILRLILWMFGI